MWGSIWIGKYLKNELLSQDGGYEQREKNFAEAHFGNMYD